MKVNRDLNVDPCVAKWVPSAEATVLGKFLSKPLRPVLSPSEHRFVVQAMARVKRYEGTNPNLVGVQMQAERMGPSWLPSVPVCVMIVEQLDKEKIG